MEMEKLNGMSSMIAGYLAKIIDDSIAENKTVNLESVSEFIKGSSNEDVLQVLYCIMNEHLEVVKNFVTDYFEQLVDDEEFVRKSDIDADMVEELNLSEDVARNYLDNLGNYDLKEWICNKINDL